jgi:kynureninase
MQAFVTSSPSIVAMAALEGALEIWDRVTIDQVRTKSLAMTDLFMTLVAQRQPGAFEVVTPLEHSIRGSQVALRHKEAYGIIQALIERNVIGDFRHPDICRFGFTPLYLRFVDVFDAVEHLVKVMDSNAYRNPRFAVRKSVT